MKKPATPAPKAPAPKAPASKTPAPKAPAPGQSFLVEIKAPTADPMMGTTLRASAVASAEGFEIDPSFAPVPVRPSNTQRMAMLADGEDNQHVVVRATLTTAQLAAARKNPDVIEIWSDPVVEPIACPIPPCDCGPTVPKGTMADVAAYLGVNQIWSAGKRGEGMVVGVVDGGITAAGRPLAAGEAPTSTINNVIGGWPVATWGTRGKSWGYHGNMCSTDVLGMAPNCRVYDLRIADAGTTAALLSNALAAFQWAINQHAINGTPHILTNSWGIFNAANAPDYASNPNHPFTRKVVEAIDAGIIVLFAAGNCGDTCPDNRCATSGPGRSIWGANGHPRVMTVGAVNKNEQFVGYSSQGPASLDPHKPDFCSITHFTGYFNSDSGTSAATPIAAGLCALLKQAKPSANHDSIKAALIATAKNIGAPGWDQHSGAGIIGGKRAYDRLVVIVKNPKELKLEKIEIKERKFEKSELKERKLEKFEIKEKREILEGKGLKDQRDLIKRVPELPVPGPIREPIIRQPIGRGIGLGQAGYEGQYEGQAGYEGQQPDGDLAARVADLEAYVESLATFISPEMRPDLAQGALANEGDLQDAQGEGERLAKDADDAMMNKMSYDNAAR